MARKEKLKDIWAMTDEPLINVMKKRSPLSSAALNNSSSSDTTSESASDIDSDFSALPEEFRPNLNIETLGLKEKRNHQMSPTQTLRKSVPSSTSRNKKALGKSTLDTGTVNRRIESRKPKGKTNHSPKMFDVNLNTSKKTDRSKKWDESMDRSTINTSLNNSEKKTLQYEYVQRQNMLQEPKLIRMTVDMRCAKDTPSTQDKELKYETSSAQNASVRCKKLPDIDKGITKQKFRKKRGYNSKGDLPTSFETSNIKWDDSLSLKPEQNNKIRWNYVQIEKRVSFESFADNSRKLKKEYITRKKFSNESENFCKFNNFCPDEMKNDQSTKCSSTRCLTAKNAKFRTKDDKNSTEFFFKENNLHSANKSKIKYNYVSEQDFKESEIQDQDRTYVKDYINNYSKQNIEHILSRSSLNETINSPCTCSQKPTNNIMQSEDSSRTQDTNTATKSSQNIEEARNCILHYGKEMSDLIIGSYTALSMLVSFYREWTVARRELINIFQQLEKNLQESSKTLSRYADIIKVAKSGSDLATNIPHPAVAMTAKIVSIITGLLQTILKSKEDQLKIDDSDVVTRAMIKDTQTTSELHMYVLQCSQQFEETTKFIKEFHSDSKIQKYFDNENPEITTFIKGFLEYKPDHRIFYKKLHKCFSELLQTSSTSFSKSFCEPFTFYSSATEVIEYLSFSFRFEDFDSTSVNHELEAISRLIGSENNTTIADLHKRIRTCIMILTEELDFRERCMKDISLFDTSTFSKKLF